MTQKETQVLSLITQEYILGSKLGKIDSASNLAKKASKLVNEKVSSDYVEFMFKGFKNSPLLQDYIQKLQPKDLVKFTLVQK